MLPRRGAVEARQGALKARGHAIEVCRHAMASPAGAIELRQGAAVPPQDAIKEQRGKARRIYKSGIELTMFVPNCQSTGATWPSANATSALPP